MSRTKKVTDRTSRRSPPARTVEGRENQLIALAVALAEKQLSEGTASAQVITHYLKLGSTTERLTREKLEQENRLLRAKTDALESAKKTEDLYNRALAAMRAYSGHSKEEDIDDDDDQD